MPTYEFACDPCTTIYRVRQGINDPHPVRCPKCAGSLRWVPSTPHLKLRNYTSPTQAKYDKLSESDEMKREKLLQQVYESIWMPSEVKHNPWDEHH